MTSFRLLSALHIVRRKTFPLRHWLRGQLESGYNWGRNMVAAMRPVRLPITDLNRFERRYFSQNGEDGVLAAIFSAVGTTNWYFVEFGIDQAACNTRNLMRHGWRGLQLDAVASPGVMHERITTENIEALFPKYGVPRDFDLLSIDIDGNDFWVVASHNQLSSARRRDRIHRRLSANESRTIAYNPEFVWDGSDCHGASLLALHRLARQKRYSLVGCDRKAVNAFFVDDALVPGRFVLRSPEQLYYPLTADYGEVPHDTDRPWVSI